MTPIHFDYETAIFLIVCITFVSWLIYKVQQKRMKKRNKLGKASQTLASFLPVFLLILSVRGFAYEPFVIPSSSMMPTLYTGDYIFVDKYSYGLKMPVFHNKLIATGSPQRGDVFVFRSVEDPSIDMIKRVIAIPGDHVKYDQKNKLVYVNGKVLQQSNSQKYQGFIDDINPNGLIVKTEHIGGNQHQMLTTNGINHPFQFTELMIPEGHYFGMGDNRDNSSDSRVFGLIPEQNIVGKARMIWMHWRPDSFFEGLKRIGTFL